jgi:osmotically-inducible protein OsmY
MAYDFDYQRGSYGRGYSTEHRGHRPRRYDEELYEYHDVYGEPDVRGSEYGEPHERGRGGPYNVPYRSQDYNPSAPYDALKYTDYEPDSRTGGLYRPSYGTEGRHHEPYYDGRYRRGAEGERGFWERAGDEVRSWFGDEEAERRRRQDEQRAGQYSGRGPRGYRRSAERIREDVNERLTDDPFLDATNIEVSVDNGIVTLTGTVDNRNDKRRAEDVAESVAGVSDVLNQLRVSQANQTQTTSDQQTTGADTTGRPRARSARA